MPAFCRIPHLPIHLITDQHLIERDRIGRTVALIARLVNDGLTAQARAVAADRETSVHIDPSTAEVTVHSTPDHESPFVYMLRTTSAPRVCVRNQPLSIADVAVYRLEPGSTFNMNSWSGKGGTAYTLSVEDGKLTSSGGDIY